MCWFGIFVSNKSKQTWFFEEMSVCMWFKINIFVNSTMTLVVKTFLVHSLSYIVSVQHEHTWMCWFSASWASLNNFFKTDRSSLCGKNGEMPMLNFQKRSLKMNLVTNCDEYTNDNYNIPTTKTRNWTLHKIWLIITIVAQH